MDTPAFHHWCPALRAGVVVHLEPGAEAVVLDPEGRFLTAIPAPWAALVQGLEGSRAVPVLLADAARAQGAFDPRGLVDLLSRLAAAGALAGPHPPIPFPRPEASVLDRLLEGLGRLMDLGLMVPAPSSWEPGTRRLGATVLAAAGMAVLSRLLFSVWLPALEDSRGPGPLATVLAALAALSLAMSLRGVVRFATLVALRRPARRLGLRVRLGLPFFDVDPRSAAGLSRLRQVLLAAMGLLALGAASLPYLLAQEGSLTRVAGMAALFSLVLNLCPFARSDGSLLLEALLGVPWLRGRTLRYLRQGLASQLRTWRTPSREERRLLGVLVLWAAWCALALPLLVFPAVIAALDATSGLLSMAVSADDALLSMAGLLLGLGLAAVFCLTSVFSVFLAASVTLRTLRTFLPPGTGRPAAADLPALEVALASAGLPRDSAPALAASGRWVSLGPEDEYPGRRGNGSMPLALLVRGKARVRRTEVSGMEHDVAEAAAGWIVPGGAAWRWSLRGTAETLLLVVDEVPPSSEVLAGRARLISSLEACSALWALGPDALRILAALPVLDVPAGADPGLKPEVLAVLLSGKLAAEGLTAPRVLPREAAGVPADAPSRLLILPPPGPGTFLPWGWRKAP